MRIALSVVLAACGSAPPPMTSADGVPSADAVVIRACNKTDRDFTELAFNSYDDRSGPLAVDQCTPYRVARGRQYSYTLVTFRVAGDDEDFTYLPIDFVGETPLAPGRYSYLVRITDHTTRDVDVSAHREH